MRIFKKWWFWVIILFSLIMVFFIFRLKGNGNVEEIRDEIKEDQEYEEIIKNSEAFNENNLEENYDGGFEEKKEYNSRVLNNNKIELKLKNKENIEDRDVNKKITELVFDIKNKIDETVFIYVDSVEVDGEKINKTSYSLGVDVEGKEEVEGVLSFDDKEREIPEMNENIKFTVHIYKKEDLTKIDDFNVEIDL